MNLRLVVHGNEHPWQGARAAYLLGWCPELLQVA